MVREGVAIQGIDLVAEGLLLVKGPNVGREVTNTLTRGIGLSLDGTDALLQRLRLCEGHGREEGCLEVCGRMK